MSFSPFQPINPVSSSLDSPDSSNVKQFKLSGSSFDEPENNMSFARMFSDIVDGVNQSLFRAGDLTRRVASGETTSIHDFAIAGAKAEVMLKLATQITSKITSAATTLFQMQI